MINYNKWSCWSLYYLSVVNFLDGLFTFLAIRFFHVQELNLIPKIIMKINGEFYFLVIKIILSFYIIYHANKLLNDKNQAELSDMVFMFILCIGFTLLVLYQLRVI